MRAVPPREGLEWIKLALILLAQRPLAFVVCALITPVGTALLLTLPIWSQPWVEAKPSLGVLATVFCYGVPSTFAVTLACAIARASDQQAPITTISLFERASVKLMLRPAAFLFALLLQGFFAAYLLRHLWQPAMLASTAAQAEPAPTFGVADTILATQLAMQGVLLLVMQLVCVFTVTPLHLFRELPIYQAWRISFSATQLNPWLIPAMSLTGVALLILGYLEPLSVVAQLVALPMPAFLGALMYVAWQGLYGQRDQAQENSIVRRDRAAI